MEKEFSNEDVLGDDVSEVGKGGSSNEEVLRDDVDEGLHQHEDEYWNEPKVGMIFANPEDLYEYWSEYGKKMGFPVKKRSSKKGADGTCKNLWYSCGREGKAISQSSNILKPRASIKTGCNVKLTALLKSDGKWHITKLSLDHNHALVSPSKSRHFPCYRVIPQSVRRRVDLNDQAGIRLNQSFNSFVVEENGYENLTYNSKDLRNLVEKQRVLRLGEGDAPALMNYFQKMSTENPGFFHCHEVDDEGRLKNIFWADKRSIEAYKDFGDVITFDTTYLTNRYDMPFAPFVGVNHHGQSMLLGCGLISYEDTPTFTWLFRAWLGCMSGHAPIGIITDQDRAMQNAIKIVFPHTRHRWCLWHIMKKMPEKLCGYRERDSISLLLGSAVYDSQTPEEFEDKWNDVINEYQLHKSDWLGTMYDERSRWIPCFVKNTFWAGMLTTQRSEGINAFFDGYVHQKTSLKQFVEQYGNPLRCKVEKETYAEFQSCNLVLKCATKYAMEQQVANVYTITKFAQFQEELTGKMYCQLSSKREDTMGTEFSILADVFYGEDNLNLKQVHFKVFVNNNVNEVKCSCQMFEFKGILCRHAIYVLLLVNSNMLLPQIYILERWKKNLSRGYTRVPINYNGWIKASGQLKYEKMMHEFTKLADVAALDDKTYTDVMNYIAKEMCKVSKRTYHRGSNNVTQSSSLQKCSRNREPSVEDEIEGEKADNQHILDPKTNKQKGRPRKKCFKKTFDKKAKQDEAKQNKVQSSRQRNKGKLIAQSQEDNMATRDTCDLSNLYFTEEFPTQESIYHSNVSCMDLLRDVHVPATEQMNLAAYYGEQIWVMSQEPGAFNQGHETRSLK